ncbi:hypothetical protein M0R45_037783 [Rubus argutus]|uniref:Trehalose 6-phosphate phosphatase n=1 Tax=Rubus argutus TaxID=59490 RepID=A0AAW1W3V8_RUBAR
MTDFAKLNQDKGFQRSSTSDKQKVQPISTKVVKNNENSDLAYSWLVEHPSALGSFDRMMNVAKGKRIVVFLDYDGTISPIVDDPDCAFMSNETLAAVREVVQG